METYMKNTEIKLQQTDNKGYWYISATGKYALAVTGAHFWDTKEDLVNTLKGMGFTIKKNGEVWK